jgi:3D (Asp-Asp-Asp) domain-containing protein
MSPFLTGVLWGSVVLLGLVTGHLAAGEIDAEPVRAAEFVAASPLAPIPSAVIEPEPEELEYQPDPVGRVCRVTAYCDRGLTAAGVPSGLGQCAAPSDIPFGALVYIPALDRTFVVTDRTARRFRYNTVDLFIPNRRDCKSFGCQYLECEITIPAERVRYGSRRLRGLLAAVR